MIEKLKSPSSSYPICEIFEHFFDGIGFIATGYEGKKAIRGFYLPDDAENNPEQYLKPLDIVERSINKPDGYRHVGIYLGKGHVAHFYDSSPNKQENKARSKFRIDSWQEFLRYNPSGGKIVRNVIFVPYKKPKLVKEHIARVLSSEERGEGSYCLIFNNCQHAVNEILTGIKFSDEATKYKVRRKIKEEIRKSNERFNNLTINDYNELDENHRKVNDYTASIVHRSS